jgi:hypothetical protein
VGLDLLISISQLSKKLILLLHTFLSVSILLLAVVDDEAHNWDVLEG